MDSSTHVWWGVSREHEWRKFGAISLNGPVPILYHVIMPRNVSLGNFDNIYKSDFYTKVENRCVGFSSLNDNGKYSFLMTNTDPYISVWLGKFIYQIFIKRNEIIQKFIE